MRLEPHAIELSADGALRELLADVGGRGNDAQWLREVHARERHLPEVVRQQSARWMSPMP